MAYEFKDMATVDMVETVADDTTVLIEEDGVIKRAPKSAVGVDSWNNLKDKPFYEEEGLIMVIPEFTFTVNTENYAEEIDGVEYYRNYSIQTLYPQFEEGATYVVTFDGVEYICECIQHDISGEGDYFYYIGNGVLSNTAGHVNTNEPFHIQQYCALEPKTISIAATLGAHTISISKRGTITHKLDHKYISLPFEALVVRSCADYVNGDGATVFDSITREDYQRLYNAIKNQMPTFIRHSHVEKYTGDDGLEWHDYYQYEPYYFDLYTLPNDSDTSTWKDVIYVYNYGFDFYIYPDGTIEDE